MTIFDLIAQEQARQDNTIELIASENFVSDNVMRAVGSCLTNKYAEGYPDLDRHSGNRGRYYGGCQYIDQIEEYCCDKWREVFKTDYHVNVQPHSGSQANYAAYAAVLKPGDTILAMELSNGGHLTHGSQVNFSGKLYNMVFYGLDENSYIDYRDICNKIIEYEPTLILAGASAYSREIDFERIKGIIGVARTIVTANRIKRSEQEKYNPYFMVDMSHIAGLVAAGCHQSPFGVADIITTTTHKTLRGPRGGMIFCKPELAKKIDSAVFPGCQGGPLPHIIAGKAVAAEEALTSDYNFYIKRVVKNCAAMAKAFMEHGYKVVTDGTDNHLLLLDLTDKGITGKQAQEALDAIGITVNKNTVPGDKRSPKETSGLRIGTAAMTTKGYDWEDFQNVAIIICKTLDQLQPIDNN